MKTPLLIVSVLLVSSTARAHSAPVLPSACSPEPLEITLPSIGLRIVAAPAGPTDQLRILYDTGTSTAQLCPADAADPRGKCAAAPPPRVLAGLGPGASLTFPAVFSARLLASGELVATDVPLVLTVGGTAYAVPTTLTSGPAGVGEDISDAPGQPIAPDGSLAIVGATRLTGLPFPYTDAPAFMRFTCVAAPAPDLDQFALAPRIVRLKGTVTASGLTLRAKLVSGDAAADFARPARVLARGTFGSRGLSLDGLVPRGRSAFVGQSTNGQNAVEIRRVKRRPVAVYRLRIRLSGVINPLPADGTTLDLAMDVGGLVTRTTQTLRARRRGTILSVR